MSNIDSKILITGAAGYIGSIVTERLINEGYSVVAMDNLEQGHKEAVDHRAIFVQSDLSDLKALDQVFQSYKIGATLHLAAKSIVSHSMTDPKSYFHANVVNGINLIDTMIKNNVYKIVFSSSAAVYGEPTIFPIREDNPIMPMNPYGESKLVFERILNWYQSAYGLNYVCLRYFNAAGASNNFGEDHHPETHLIAKALEVSLGREENLPIFGNDQNTEDGTCIRDYIHVLDIATAHILALENLERKQGGKIFNLGNGEGYSILEVVRTIEQIANVKIPLKIYPKREGDPPRLVASSQRIKEEWGWQPQYPDLESIVRSAWLWKKEYPHGYKSCK